MNVVFRMPKSHDWPEIINLECDVIPRQGEMIALPVEPKGSRQIFTVTKVLWSVEGRTIQECYITVVR